MSSKDGKPGVLVPVKRLHRSKTRLEPVLDEQQRKKLSWALCRDTVNDLEQLKSRAKPCVVTADPEVEEYAVEKGVGVCPEPDRADNLGEIVDHAGGRDWLHPDAGLLVFPVDLPWVDADALEGLLDRCDARRVVLVPDRKRGGTNALWRRPADLFPCQYRGTSSFDRHRRAAQDRGYSPEVHPDPAFGFDLDTPADWERFTRRPARLSEHTRDFLERYFSDIRNRVI